MIAGEITIRINKIVITIIFTLGLYLSNHYTLSLTHTPSHIHFGYYISGLEKSGNQYQKIELTIILAIGGSPKKEWNSMSFGATHLSTLYNGGYFNSSHLREYVFHIMSHIAQSKTICLNATQIKI